MSSKQAQFQRHVLHYQPSIKALALPACLYVAPQKLRVEQVDKPLTLLMPALQLFPFCMVNYVYENGVLSGASLGFSRCTLTCLPLLRQLA
jgi:hypothetical protein